MCQVKYSSADADKRAEKLIAARAKVNLKAEKEETEREEAKRKRLAKEKAQKARERALKKKYKQKKHKGKGKTNEFDDEDTKPKSVKSKVALEVPGKVEEIMISNIVHLLEKYLSTTFNSMYAAETLPSNNIHAIKII